MINKFTVDEHGEVQVVRQRIRKWSNYTPVLDSKPECNKWREPDVDISQFIYGTRKGRPLPIDNCVPDMVMSMQDIYQRYLNNREVPTVLASYDSDELDALMPDFSRMSKVEVLDILKENNKRIENWRIAKEAADEAAAKRAIDERNAEFERLRGIEADLIKKREIAEFTK